MRFPFFSLVLFGFGLFSMTPLEAARRGKGHSGSDFKGFNPCGWNTCLPRRSRRPSYFRGFAIRRSPGAGFMAPQGMTMPRPPASPSETPAGLALFKRTCLECHSKSQGGLPAVGEWEREHWEKAIRTVENGSMPKNNPGSLKGNELNQLIQYFNRRAK